MELVINTRIYYSNKGMVPLGEVAKSLLALEKMASHAGGIAEGLQDGLKVKSINVFIEKIETGSIQEDIIFKILVDIQGRLQDKLESFGKFTSVDFIKDNKAIFSWSLLALAMFGGGYAFNALNPNQPSTVIENHTTVVLNLGKELTGLQPEQLIEIIESATKGKKGELAKDAVRFIRPTKADPKASIKIGDNFEIPADVAKSIPSTYLEDASDDPTIIDFVRTEVQIRATDLDSQKRGWGAIVPAFGERRIKLHIAPGIPLHRIVAGKTIVGDITVFYQTDEDGNARSLQGDLHKVYWPEDENIAGN